MADGGDANDSDADTARGDGYDGDGEMLLQLEATLIKSKAMVVLTAMKQM